MLWIHRVRKFLHCSYLIVFLLILTVCTTHIANADTNSVHEIVLKLSVEEPSEAAADDSARTLSASEITSVQMAFSGAAARTIGSAYEHLALAYIRPMSGGAHVFSVNPPIPLSLMQPILTELTADPRFEYVAPNLDVFISSVEPNDPLFADQWNLTDKAMGINAPMAWEKHVGSPRQVVAVLDTGIAAHVDLNDRVIQGYDFVSAPHIGNDGDGRDPDASDPGTWCDNKSSSWHGTKVASIVAANANNYEGIVGIDWQTKILPVRVLGRCNSGSLIDVAEGIRWAAGLPVDGVPTNTTPAGVINLSLAAPINCSYLPYLQSAIDVAVLAGSVVVTAAGNSGGDAKFATPASCNNVITVGASGLITSRADYSNFGDVVDISAPGGWLYKILTASNSSLKEPDSGSDIYEYEIGTSFAAPHVSGAVSLMQTLYEGAKFAPQELEEILKSTAKPFPEDHTGCAIQGNCGAGILDVGAALDAVPAPAYLLGSSTSLGSTLTCVILRDRSVRCRGSDIHRRTQVPEDLRALQLAVGLENICALNTEYDIVCWGSDRWGQASPPQIKAKQLASGRMHSCAIDREDLVTCWGRSGSFGYGGGPPSDLHAKSIALGSNHGCAISYTDDVVCWGRNADGQANVPLGLKAKQLSAGIYHSCAVTLADRVQCWGHRYMISPMPDNLKVKHIHSGAYGTCAIKLDDKVICWGWYYPYGQNRAPANLLAKDLGGGIYHYCAVKFDGAVTCWGWPYEPALNVPETGVLEL